MKRLIRIPEDAELPLIGLVQLGVVDRGTNLLQLRPITTCNLNCVFCSTDSGKFSKCRVSDYMIDLDYFLDGLKEIIKFKGKGIHAHIDTVGEPLTYPMFIDLISRLSEIEEFETVAFETNGTLLTEEIIDELNEVGLTRINLSVHSLDDELAKKLTSFKDYNVSRIIELIGYVTNTPIELTLTPVWIPGMNDEEICKIIEFAKSTIKNKRFPILGIQKYEAHKFGRKPKGIKPISWWKFYRKLEGWEKQFKIKLRLSPKDFEVEKRRGLPRIFERGEKVKVEIKASGWLKNEMIGIAKDRCMTVVNCNANPGEILKVKILENKHNLYIAR
ncbi:MAG: radical SAM protein [Candidatus Aenigmarchaeota archaeon]|nr:radical SAM protein [Candidatus Aenigmarchaeota archaeon]